MKKAKINRCNFSAYVLIVVLIFSVRCNNDPKAFADNKKSSLPIIHTGYTYKDYQIFKKSIIACHGLVFFNNEYFLLKNRTIYYGMHIFKDCSDNYKKGDYKIFDIGDSVSFVNDLMRNFECHMRIKRYFSTDYKTNDTIFEPFNDYCILKDRFIDTSKSISDTTYIFERMIGVQNVGFSFNYTQGFLGIYRLCRDSNNIVSRVERYYGDIYEEKLKTFYPKAKIENYDCEIISANDFDLGLIKEFEKQ